MVKRERYGNLKRRDFFAFDDPALAPYDGEPCMRLSWGHVELGSGDRTGAHKGLMTRRMTGREVAAWLEANHGEA